MRACLELSRRCGRRFLYMMNREAFDEGFGSAGWWLQRLGAFSVERGGRNEQAKRYADRRGETGTGRARHLPGRGDLLLERPGAALQERRRRDRDAGRGRGRGRPGRTGPLTWSRWPSSTVTASPSIPCLERRTRLMEQHLFRRIHATRSPEGWASSWPSSCIARRRFIIWRPTRIASPS